MQDATRLLYQHAPQDIALSIYNAQPDILLHDLSIKTLIQEDRAMALALQRHGYQLQSDVTTPQKHILMLAHKQNVQSCGWMARAMLALEEGGTFSICCPNRMGARNYEKKLQQLAGSLSGRLSKKKCRLFHAKRSHTLDVNLAKQWQQAAALQWVDALQLYSSPGLFSWNHSDTGSKLLLQHLPDNLSGIGMDVGCGNGYLSSGVLKKCQNIRALHLLDVFWPALQAAKKNCLSTEKCPLYFHHLDAIQERLPVQPDWIILNPPFHAGQKQDTTLGQQIIQTCCQSMKKGAVLYMVANRHLPYEQLLKEQSTSFQALTCEQGFKVLRAII